MKRERENRQLNQNENGRRPLWNDGVPEGRYDELFERALRRREYLRRFGRRTD